MDLLYGCPGQDLAAWTRTLVEVLAWGVEHLSAYALTLEPGTPFGRRPPPDLPDEATQVAQFERLLELTARAGLVRYEISNFARPGYCCRHNLLYWRREDYVGLGPGAHGAFGPLRVANLRSQTRYRAAVLAGRWPIEAWERLGPARVRGEQIVLGLRLAEGIPRAWLEAPVAEGDLPRERLLAAYREGGWLEERDGRVVLTPRGILVSDAIFPALL